MRSSRAALGAALLVPALSWGQDIPHEAFITEAEFLASTDVESPALRALRHVEPDEH